MQLSIIPITLLLALGSPSQQLLAQAPTPTPEEQIAEGVRLNNNAASVVYKDLIGIDELQTAFAQSQQALTIFKKYGAKAGEANSLVNIGYVYFRKGEYAKALEHFQSSLDIYRKIRDRENEWIPLSYMGEVYVNLGQYSKALEAYQPALAILRELKAANPKASSYSTSEKIMLADVGAIYFRMGQYPKSLDFYQQSLAIYKAGDDKIGAIQTLNNIGVVYVNLGDYTQALDSYEQALKNLQDCCSNYLGTKAAIINNLSGTYFSLGQYQKSLKFAEESSTIYSKLSSTNSEEINQKDIKLIYDYLGQNSQHLQQVTSRATVGESFGKDSFQFQGRAINFNNIGQIYLNLSQYDQALKLYEQALKLYKENNFKPGIAASLNNIGRVNTHLGKYPQAIEFNNQALTLYKEIGDRTGEGVTLSNLGQIHQKQNQYLKAAEFYQQALALHREVTDKVSEATTLKFLGDSLSAQKQPQLAIAFYKQSVNLTESIRQNLRVMPTAIQQSYTETVAERYRRLADLLLQQNRPAEAQQVLDLLKIQEMNDFIGHRGGIPQKTAVANTRQRGSTPTAEGTSQSPQNLPLKPQEQDITQKYNAIQDKAIALGQELTNLRKIPKSSRTSAQEKRIAELVTLEQTMTDEFNKFTKNPAVVALVQQLSATSGQENLSLRQLNSIRDNLRQLNKKAVLLYPLVLEDRLELVVVTADAPPIHRPVPVKQAELERAIAEFRETLVVPYKDSKVPGNQLYKWLIQPIENDLKQANAQAIIYAPDGKLRYIPLAALYDGKNWLVERFIVNNITAASLTKLNNQPLTSLPTLAAAFTKGEYQVAVGERQEIFSGLKFAKVEVENLAKTIASTKILLDKDFTSQTTIPQMNDYKIVHLATHGMLVSGNPEDSFILFGDGERVTLKDIENWSLPNVDLVVLSACQTGLGKKLGNGQEILGLGYQIQLTGAKASIASLWTVSDGGTQALMNEFYTTLKSGKLTKAEALRTAQLNLITAGNNQFNHPYYWAAFILIGNGL
ncbi:tetratricopeptide repeat protein [Scytonema sp. UIC 10036]|uniref:CHAT domain-containing protein n=1 Tax=Scytonema sp. UIC 10036 TaxID=2304196 RepID=UPI0012DAEE08|nr:tetratricopeptide repeat protein [Scytonema sp. UIC 10036]MUG95825.1 tetratricopeptide repeat protein [Scytonema sp. UIC 10036]